MNLLDSRSQRFKKWVKYSETEDKAIRACNARIFFVVVVVLLSENLFGKHLNHALLNIGCSRESRMDFMFSTENQQKVGLERAC